jgi:hypothetical protein
MWNFQRRIITAILLLCCTIVSFNVVSGTTNAGGPIKEKTFKKVLVGENSLQQGNLGTTTKLR